MRDSVIEAQQEAGMSNTFKIEKSDSPYYKWIDSLYLTMVIMTANPIPISANTAAAVCIILRNVATERAVDPRTFTNPSPPTSSPSPRSHARCACSTHAYCHTLLS